MKIKVKYFSDKIDKLEKIEKGDLIDLRNVETIDLKRGQSKLIRLGVAMELPKGYHAEIYPRSSTFKNYGILLTNSVGVIDNSYCGDNDEWMALILATKDVTIWENTRLFQFRIVENMPTIEFEEVEHLGNADRNGYGSTGTK